MCEDLRPIPELNAIVYKMVAKRPKGKKYFSIAMGFKYPQKGKVPKIRIQHCLGLFDKNILNLLSWGYEPRMIGRTAGFVIRRDAEIKARYGCRFIPGYQILVVKAELTGDLMIGTYGTKVVIAGRHIEFLE